MWVRSQDKEVLVNADTFYIVENVRKYNDRTENKYYIKTDLCTMEYNLGVYATKEKALKVLDMIQNRILSKDYSTTGIGYPIIKDKVFQMPQDSEVE